MNPLHWPREHQLAWVLATVLGGIAGLVATLSLFPTTGRLMIVTNQFWDNDAATTVVLALKMGFVGGAVLVALTYYVVKLIAAGNSK